SHHCPHLYIRPSPPHLPLFPYTTLFRSSRMRFSRGSGVPAIWSSTAWVMANLSRSFMPRPPPSLGAGPGWPDAEGRCARPAAPRSEEHTSELQSRENLVCRLLLEKKNLQ